MGMRCALWLCLLCAFSLSMASFEDFKKVGDSLSQEQRSQIFQMYSSDKASAVKSMMDLAAGAGVSFTEEELTSYVDSLMGESASADGELSSEQLASVAGGKRGVTWGCMGWDGR